MAERDFDSIVIACPHCRELLLWRDSKHILYDAYHKKTLHEWLTEELENYRKGDAKWDVRRKERKGRSNINLKKE